MRPLPAISPAVLALAALSGGVAACAQAEGADPALAGRTQYLGVETRLLDRDLVQFRVALSGGAGRDGVDAYARCAAAQYAAIRDMGFAQHVRTRVAQDGGIWRGDAVYTLSAVVPPGERQLDAEVVLADCAARDIPTV